MPKGEHLKGKGGLKFGSGQPTDRGGRPKKIYTVLKEKGFSGDDIKTAFGEMAWYTLNELKQVHKDEKKPVIMRIVANQFYLALSKGDWGKVKEILEHTIGRPTQGLEHSGKDGQELPPIIFLQAPDDDDNSSK